MKNRILPILLLIPYFAFAQTAEERVKIASYSNKEGNARLAVELKQDEEQRQNRLAAYFSAHPEAKKIIKKDETGTVEIMDVLPNGELILARTDNAGSALTARVNSLYGGGALNINIQGQNMIAGVWDEGSARDTHQEFMVDGTSKIAIWDGSASSNHATHVAGTIAAQGILPAARGIAFNASINSYRWDNDLAEMLAEAQQGLLVSNHSYGIGALGSQWFYGAYDSRARQIDEITYANPFYLPVISAGNDRNGIEPPASTQIAAKSGYDLIFGHANAKNAITVAAVGEVADYVDESSVIMSSFSSWGPSDDGRIKPEISMKGVGVRSAVNTSDTATGIMNGTSMASPGVTGVVTLLQQYHHQLYNNYMRSATVKGLILHTADETGYDIGPDYAFGWGLINADKSAKLIRDKNLTTNRSVIEDLTLAQGATYSKGITANGSGKLQVSISWTDPASPSFNNGVTDPTIKYLINDLDVKVTSSTGTVFYPWKLQGMGNTAGPPSNNSTNDVDNFERIDIPNPTGSYTVTVSHKGNLTNGSQNYSLIISSPNLATLASDEVSVLNSDVRIYPNPASDFVFIKNFVKGSKVSILDMSGRILEQKVLTENFLSVKHLIPGNYLILYVGKDGNQISEKLLKN